MCEMSGSSRLAKFRTAQADKQNWQCFYCGFPMWEGDLALPSEHRRLPIGLLDRFLCTAEHLEPKMNGGKNRPDNLVAACRFCNQTRHKMRDVLSPAAYQQHVRRRIRARKWHPIECHRLFG
ncbi:HNH endonuclease [Mesorhizobium sp. M00.F.Ca.ET.186.01.1.1]|nr:HNH endonuclease [bacterium M00.F.Ca.ET.205.01.1.1]TGU53611.1 HNH endonuclease [bacterium M00.F.Ca.ET.152.01.1.1]TGV37110.1 HNH endonuclease [Mesorhizobium sp. M00.F.Ca.ET.186.01.1.1]TGZ41462.1 HNH endonuclease [bacterium M00.F.Ca.ET.162.01.1.1]TIW61268.1 MAG: HNH endonuclease [Mesorhizobium sp.]